jgi:hypothetical protein
MSGSLNDTWERLPWYAAASSWSICAYSDSGARENDSNAAAAAAVAPPVTRGDRRCIVDNIDVASK